MANNFIFPSFKMNLGFQKVDWDSEINVWLTPKLKKNTVVDGMSLSEENFEFKEKKVNWLKAGVINGFNIDSVNKITSEKSDNTYEAMEQYPASAYIFSNECPTECWVPKDYEYVTLGPDHYKVAESKLDNLNTDYWNNNYSFSDGYDSTEYDYYNLEQHSLNEDRIRLNPNNTIMSAASSFSGIKEYTGEGCVITYTEQRPNTMEDIYHPICYIEFSKKHSSILGKFKIDWASDGCIQAE